MENWEKNIKNRKNSVANNITKSVQGDYFEKGGAGSGRKPGFGEIKHHVESSDNAVGVQGHKYNHSTGKHENGLTYSRYTGKGVAGMTVKSNSRTFYYEDHNVPTRHKEAFNELKEIHENYYNK